MTNSSEQSDARSKNEEVDASEESSKNLLKEAMRDIFVSLALVILTTLITHGDLQKAPTSSILATGPQIRSSPPPKPIFGGDNSYIDDYYTGDIFAAFEEANNYENALMMFYAPWDADSLRAVKLLENVAKTFVDNDIYFAAVNCWEPKGECNQEFNGEKGKTARNPRLAQHQYPIFVFYPNDRRGIQYHGPISIQSLVEFLILARYPYLHIGSKNDLSQLRASYSGKSLLGYFPNLTNSSNSRRAFKIFVDSSYQLLEQDPFLQNTGGIGVVTSPQLAFSLQLDISRPIRYFHWNGTSIAYPNKTLSSPQSLYTWTKSQIGSNFVTWTGVAGRKSLNLSNRLETGSQNSLILFANRQNGKIYNHALHLIQELALQYNTCDQQSDSNHLYQWVHDLHRTNFLEQDAKLNECLRDPWFLEYFGQDFSLDGKNTSVHSWMKLKRKWSLGQPLVDSQVVEVKRMSQRLSCAVMASALCDVESRQSVFDENSHSLLWSYGCQDNRTLNFYLIDKVTQWSLLHHLGLQKKVEKANAIIVSLLDEKVYVMDEDLSLESLETFIRTFHDNVNQLKVLKQSKVLEESSADNDQKSEEIDVHEVSASDFTEKIAIATKKTPVVVLYTSPSCAFCQVVTHIFHTLGRLISSELVNFLTIDSTQNDLPWSYTALAVPSILYFHPRSAHGLAANLTETRAFPAEKPFSVANLLSFIVANLDAQSRIKLALSICGEDCITEAKVKLAQDHFLNPDLSLETILEPLLKKHDEL